MSTTAGEEDEVPTSLTSSPVTVPTSLLADNDNDDDDDDDDDNHNKSSDGSSDELLIDSMSRTSPLPPSSSSSSSSKIPSSRFRLWYALTVFSAVSLISLSIETDTTSQQRWQLEEKWILSVTLMSLIFSSLATLAHIVGPLFFRERLVTMLPTEGLLLFTELGLWIGGLIVMMDTNNMIAVDENGRILNPNLYFSSWASLVITVSLFIEYGQEVSSSPASNRTTILTAGYWSGVCVASLVMLIASIQMFVAGVTLQGQEFLCQDQSEGGDNNGFSGLCKRLKFSIALGLISSVVAGACTMMMLSFKTSQAVQTVASFAMFFGWVLGVAVVTFGSKSPGNDLGNLYFSCWAAFVLCLFMVSNSLEEALASREGGAATEDENKVDVPADPSSEKGKADELPSKANLEEAETTTTPTEGPMTPNSISVIKDGQSLGVPSDESTDPVAPFPTVDIPASKV